MRAPLFTGHAAEDELAKLRIVVRAADRRAVLAPGRVVRRVLHHVKPFSPFAFHTPHGDCCAVDRDRVFEVVRPHEIDLDPASDLPGTLFLLALPENSDPYLLADRHHRRICWRRLFHARIHDELEKSTLRTADLPGIIHLLGQAAFDEIRAVLKQEDRVLPPGDDHTVFVEFAAFYLELHAFEPYLLPLYFPSAPEPARVLEILGAHLDPDTILRETHVEGAGEAVARDEAVSGFDGPALPLRPPPDARRRRTLLARSTAAANRANHARAALLAHRAGSLHRAEAEIGRLLVRLVNVLDLPPEEIEAWRWGLRSLVPHAARGFRPAPARILFDLQKICVDHERGLFAVDPVEWLLTFGRRPVRRPLPMAVLARRVRLLARVEQRLAELEITRTPGATLHDPVMKALATSTKFVEDTFLPLVRSAVSAVGLVPANLPERVAARNLEADLAERAVTRGRLRIGDVRDAISGNDLKLSGPRSPIDVVKRDPLLRLDRILAASLDGVYRRAEFYLRWLHRLSTVVLGTLTGSLLVRFAILPFGGAFVVLEGLQHLIGLVLSTTTGAHPHLATPAWIAALGAFFLLLIHFSAFRHGVSLTLKTLGRFLRGVFVSLPTWLVWRPFIARFLDSGLFRFLMRTAIKPAAYTAALTAIVWSLTGPVTAWTAAAPLFVLALATSNLPTWRRTEEAIRDNLARNWRLFRTHVVAGAIRAVIAFFRLILDAMDRLLHSVDEWLRFRGGEGRPALFLKALLAPVWFVISYVVRLYVNLLVEPQVNPVKHFPVVTVSHKLILPLLPRLTRLLRNPLMPLGAVPANAIAGTTVFLLPGVFGFLVWELKENWRLFARNRPTGMRPVPVGHHGETVTRLLRPGFHSGTLPKLFARLRRAESLSDHEDRRRRRDRLGRARKAAEDAVRRFMEREFVQPLLECGLTAGLSVAPGEVRTGSNGIRVRVGAAGADALEVAFEDQSGRLVAGIVHPGWTASFSEHARLAVRNALLGLYKKAGVELVREQISAALGRRSATYDISGRDLVVWPDPGLARSIRYDLSRRPALRARPLPGIELPMFLPAHAVVFSVSPLRWKDWVDAWEAAGPDRGAPPALLDHVPALPEEKPGEVQVG